MSILIVNSFFFLIAHLRIRETESMETQDYNMVTIKLLKRIKFPFCFMHIYLKKSRPLFIFFFWNLHYSFFYYYYFTKQKDLDNVQFRNGNDENGMKSLTLAQLAAQRVCRH